VIGTLKAAFVQGRLDRDEFDLRVTQAFASRTYAELAAVTADLPAGLAGAQLPEPAQESVNKKAVAAMACATAACIGVWYLTMLTPDGSPFAVPVIVAFFSFIWPCRQAGLCCCTAGSTSALAGRPRRGCHREQAVRHTSACHQPARAGSSHRAMTAAGTPPMRRRSFVPACCPASRGGR